MDTHLFSASYGFIYFYVDEFWFFDLNCILRYFCHVVRMRNGDNIMVQRKYIHVLMNKNPTWYYFIQRIIHCYIGFSCMGTRFDFRTSAKHTSSLSQYVGAEMNLYLQHLKVLMLASNNAKYLLT